LEELIAALVAQQRDALILLRQIASDVGAVLDRLPALSNREQEGGRAYSAATMPTTNGDASR
jgi:hypothetical protein